MCLGVGPLGSASFLGCSANGRSLHRMGGTMRSDMSKVLCETGREAGMPSGGRRDQWARLDPEELATREGMRRRHRQRKHFGEHLSPLWRFLGSRVGRPWDDVYSEIRAQLSPRSVLDVHLLDHLEWEVETRPLRIDGDEVWSRSGRPFRGRFFVDGKRILRRNSYRRGPSPRRTEAEHGVVWTAADAQYRQIGGAWFFVKLARHPGDSSTVRDVVTASRVRSGILYPGRRLYAWSKRQVGRREIRQRVLPHLPSDDPQVPTRVR